MLDYTANAVAYWPVGSTRATFQALDGDADEKVSELLAADGDALPDEVVEDFWGRVEQNLRDGRIRLIFVADDIPRELRRIIEFLNEQMSRAEVLGVEIKQYVNSDGGLRTLVPRVISKTVAAEDIKRPSSPRTTHRWDHESFITAVKNESGNEASVIAESIYEWAKRRSTVGWEGGANASMLIRIPGASRSAFVLYASGRIDLYFAYLEETGGVFAQPDLRSDLLARLNSAVSASLDPASASGFTKLSACPAPEPRCGGEVHSGLGLGIRCNRISAGRESWNGASCRPLTGQRSTPRPTSWGSLSAGTSRTWNARRSRATLKGPSALTPCWTVWPTADSCTSSDSLRNGPLRG